MDVAFSEREPLPTSLENAEEIDMTDPTRRGFTTLAGAAMVPLFAPAVLGQAKAQAGSWS